MPAGGQVGRSKFRRHNIVAYSNVKGALQSKYKFQGFQQIDTEIPPSLFQIEVY